METPPADHITGPLAELDTKTQKDLPTAQAASPAKDTETQNDLLTTQVASPAKLESQVAPTARSGDKLTSPPTLSGHMVKDSVYQL